MRVARASAALVLLAALPLVGGSPSAGFEASAPALVSNLDEESTSARERLGVEDFAQAFTTGSAANGYVVTQVTLSMTFGTTQPTFTVKVHADSSGAPGAEVGTLSVSGSVSGGRDGYVSFVHDGLALSKSTTYWIVVDVSAAGSDGDGKIDVTNSDKQLGLSGWGIGDSYFDRSRSTASGGWSEKAKHAMRIGIFGYEGFPSKVVVSNLAEDQFAGASAALTDGGTAAGFTTGAASRGYTVTSLSLSVNHNSVFTGVPVPEFTVSIRESTGGVPGDVLGELSQVGSFPIGSGASFSELEFTHEGIHLAPSTPYFVVYESPTAFQAATTGEVTTSTDQTGATGWLIADTMLLNSLANPTWRTWRSTVSGQAVNPVLKFSLTAHVPLPDPPLSVSAATSDSAPGSFLVSWEASNTSKTQFLVQWKGAMQSYSTTERAHTVTTQAVRSHLVSGLTPGASYDARVTVLGTDPHHDVHADTAESAEASAWDLTLAPHVTNAGAFGLQAAWDAFPGATKYRVQHKGPGEEYSTTTRSTETADATVVSKQISQLTAGAQYQVQVTALKGTTNPTVLATTEASAVVTFDGFDADATSVDLVGNLATTSAGSADAGSVDRAQAFTTGALGWGYVLTGASLDLSFGATRADFDVNLHADDEGKPGAVVARLSPPASLASLPAGVSEFSTGGVPLAADTTYWVVVDGKAAGDSLFSYTDTSALAGQAEAGLAGWNVADSSLTRTLTSSGAWSTLASQALRLKVSGYEITPESSLVGNMGESVWRLDRDGDGAVDLAFRTVGFLDRAQAFTTGSNAGGYVLDGVGLQMSFGASPATYEVSINADAGGAPGELLGVLKAPTSAIAGAARFTHEGVWLAPNSRYWLVIDGERAGDAKYALTTSAAQASTAGWSVADGSLLRHDLFQGMSEASKWKAGSSATPFGVLKLGVLGEANDAWSSVSVAAPTNASAAAYSTALDVSWQAAGGAAPATGYAVEWEAVGDGDDSFAANRVRVGPSVLSRQITGLLPGTAYQVRVVAEGGSRDGDAVYASRPVSTNPWVPSVSHEFSLTGDAHALRARFTAIPSASGYRLHWRSAGQQYSATERFVGKQAVAGQAQTILTHPLPLGGVYWLRVEAGNTAGVVIGVSEEVRAKVVAPIAGLTVTPSAPGAAGALQVTWDAPSPPLAGATHYLVSKTEGPLEGDRSVPCVDVDGAVQPCAPSDLPVPCADSDGVIYRGYDVFDSTSLTLPVTAGRRYRVCVSARTRNGDTRGAAQHVPVVVPAAASALTARPVPGDPTGLDVDWSDLALGWSEVAAGSPYPVEGYRVRWRADDEPYDDSGNERQHDTDDSSETSYRIGGLSELGVGQRYSVQVTALQTVGDQKTEGASAEVTYKKPSVPPPGSGARVAAPVSDDDSGASSSSTAGGTVILANGWSPADIAVAAALSAGIDGSAVAYTQADTLAEPTEQLLSEHRPARLIVVGGDQAVTPAAVRDAQQAAHSGRAERVQGADRAATAAAAARRAWQSTAASERTAIIANGWSAADTAAAAALAARTPAAAVAFTAADKLPQATADLLSEQRPQQIIVIGGTQAVADSVAAAARAAAKVPAAAVTRLAGDTRADTAAQIARRVLSGAPAGSATIVIANGHSPSDIGVAASAAARTPRSAVLYTAPGDTPQATLDLLREHRPARVVIIGGAQAVSTQITDTIRAAVGAGTRVVRYTGATRIHTSTRTARTVLTLR